MLFYEQGGLVIQKGNGSMKIRGHQDNKEHGGLFMGNIGLMIHIIGPTQRCQLREGAPERNKVISEMRGSWSYMETNVLCTMPPN